MATTGPACAAGMRAKVRVWHVGSVTRASTSTPRPRNATSSWARYKRGKEACVAGDRTHDLVGMAGFWLPARTVVSYYCGFHRSCDMKHKSLFYQEKTNRAQLWL